SANLVVRLKQQGYSFDQVTDTPHATVSVPVLKQQLETWGMNATLARRVAVAVGGHHGVFPAAQQWASLTGTATLGNEQWQVARQDILHALADLLELPRDRVPTGGDGPDQSSLMVLAGLTAVADWIGSNKAFFPEQGNNESPHLEGNAAEVAARD